MAGEQTQRITAENTQYSAAEHVGSGAADSGQSHAAEDAQHIYIAIDLKSFYASVECVERGLDPLDANLVVADTTRSEKTICLAVSPPLKAEGVPGRPRLFEVVQKVREINAKRRAKAPGKRLEGSSHFASELVADPSLELGYIIARPRMAYYMEYSTRIYEIYLRYVAPEDIHIYSIDEVFIDATDYLRLYGLTAHQFAMTLVREVLAETGVTATAGIGTNMYLAKIAMDINAKHAEADADGVRIAELDEASYRRTLWGHRPITDFWRIGHGYARRLAKLGLYTMGDIARCSLGGPNDFHNEELLYKTFGINAELLIDHAWGWEPCRMQDIKSYRSENNSLSSGQVLMRPYPYESAKLIVREMTDLLVLDLVEKKLVCDQMLLDLGYDSVEHQQSGGAGYRGTVEIDRYGRRVPKPAHGSVNLGRFCSSTRIIMDAVMELFERIADPKLSVRRVTVTANHVVPEGSGAAQKSVQGTAGLGLDSDVAGESVAETAAHAGSSGAAARLSAGGSAFVPGNDPTAIDDFPADVGEQLDMFTDYEGRAEARREEEDLAAERRRQEAILAIRQRYGKNAILKGMNLQEDGTTIERNRQIGGHKA